MTFNEGTNKERRLYTFLEMRSAWCRNLWTFWVGLTQGYGGLDPEQNGKDDYVISRLDLWPVLALMTSGFFVLYSGLWGLLFFAVSPVIPCMFLELGNDRDPGPRVWLSRWYFGVLGIVLLWDGFPAWVRWLVVTYWALVSFRVSRFYANERLFYEQVKRENPNRAGYRLATLPFLYLRDGQQSLAEDEYAEVLAKDPTNWKALLTTQLLAANRAWHEKGFIGLGFTCAYCGEKQGRMVKDFDTLTRLEHDAYFHRVCPLCGKRSEFSVLPE